MFSLVRGLAIISVGPVGLALVKLNPGVSVDDYALSKYTVSKSMEPVDISC